MTVTAKLGELRKTMRDAAVDLVVLGPGSHQDWLVGFHTYPDERPCLLLVGREREAFLMPALNMQEARKQTDIHFEVWSDDEGPHQALSRALKNLGCASAKSVVVDETMRADFALLVLDALPGAKHQFTAQTLGSLRMRKTQDEYELLAMNAAIADRAVGKAFAAIKAGMSENQIAAIIREQFASEAADTQFAMVGSGANGALPHHTASERVLAEGDVVVVDIGATKDGYCSDITRMAVVGAPSDEFIKVHGIVERAVKAAMAAAKPGVKACEVDLAARAVITDAGYGEYFVHRTGHGLGIDGHEPPYITASSQTVLEEGMVFSIEPGIYLPGRFGVRLEDIVILRGDGPEAFSKLPLAFHKA